MPVGGGHYLQNEQLTLYWELPSTWTVGLPDHKELEWGRKAAKHQGRPLVSGMLWSWAVRASTNRFPAIVGFFDGQPIRIGTLRGDGQGPLVGRLQGDVVGAQLKGVFARVLPRETIHRETIGIPIQLDTEGKSPMDS